MGRRIVKVSFRRRRKRKTDYKARESFLKAKEPRLVIRKTNRYLIVHIVKSKEAQDFTLCYANSKELNKFGWHMGLKNIPAAYLTGLLIAKKAKEKGIKKVIVDIGLLRSTKGSKIYAVVKGAIDGGLSIPFKIEMAPSEERIRGKDSKRYSEKINSLFEEIKNNILNKK